MLEADKGSFLSPLQPGTNDNNNASQYNTINMIHVTFPLHRQHQTCLPSRYSYKAIWNAYSSALS